ncbi:hypothetical protein ABZ234_28390 [Nocardiopsis sp. NPDC006198]|uniref:hypothetical protein n=1 Tax=Nocardiopsis sp. NPDC006198 TaxID=3154472 RepID=UPI0033B403AC
MTGEPARSSGKRRGRAALAAVAGVAVLLAAAVLLVRQAGGPEEPEAGPTASPEEGGEPRADAEWVRRQVRILTLERMFAESDPAEIVGEASEDTRSALLEGGAVVEDGQGTRVETDPAEWTVADHLGEQGIRLASVDNAMDALLWENDVTWCGGAAVAGRDFVHDYLDTHEGAFDTQEEYLESIADHVDCGSGAPG